MQQVSSANAAKKSDRMVAIIEVIENFAQRKCAELIWPHIIVKKDAKSQYIYIKSMERYLKIPEHKQLYDDLEKAIRSGEIGTCENKEK